MNNFRVSVHIMDEDYTYKEFGYVSTLIALNTLHKMFGDLEEVVDTLIMGHPTTLYSPNHGMCKVTLKR